MKSIIGASSLKGLREEQQDSYCFAQLEDCLVVVVCDGNGGRGGKEVSKVAAKKALSESCSALSRLEDNRIDSKRLKAFGLKALKKAEGKVNRVKRINGWKTSGTTLTLIIVTPDLIGTFWIGDSPAYQYEGGKLIPLIVPHTLAEELIREGQSRESISQQPSVNCILMQCLGHKASNPGVLIKEHDGDCLCIVGSDGFFDYMPLDNIGNFIDAGFVTTVMQHVTEDFVRKALSYGSDDNVTAIMFSYLHEKPEKKPTRYF